MYRLHFTYKKCWQLAPIRRYFVYHHFFVFLMLCFWCIFSLFFSVNPSSLVCICLLHFDAYHFPHANVFTVYLCIKSDMMAYVKVKLMFRCLSWSLIWLGVIWINTLCLREHRIERYMQTISKYMRICVMLLHLYICIYMEYTYNIVRVYLCQSEEYV